MRLRSSVLIVAMAAFPVCAQDAPVPWQNPLPKGSHTIPDAAGKLVGCLPPDDQAADAEFKARCEAFLDHKKLARVSVPIRQSSWVSASDWNGIKHPADGATIVHVSIGPDGNITDCTAQTAGNYEALDAKVCDRIKIRGRFTPALDDMGNAKTSTFSFPVMWH